PRSCRPRNAPALPSGPHTPRRPRHTDGHPGPRRDLHAHERHPRPPPPPRLPPPRQPPRLPPPRRRHRPLHRLHPPSHRPPRLAHHQPPHPTATRFARARGRPWRHRQIARFAESLLTI